MVDKTNQEERRKIQQKALEAANDPSSRKVLNDPEARKQILKQVKTTANETGMVDKKVTPKITSGVSKILADDAKLRKSIDKIGPGKKKPGIKDQLVSAVLLMTPQILGTVIGGAVGGGDYEAAYEGAKAGEASARDMMEHNLDMQLKQKKLEEQDKPDLLSPGERLRAEQFLAAEKSRNRREERLQSQGDRRIEQQDRSLDLRKEKLRQFNPAQQKEIVAMDGVNFVISDMEALLENRDFDTGEFIGAGKDIAMRYGLSSDMDQVELIARANLLLAEQLKTYSGTAVNEAEIARWEKILMSAKDRPEIFRTKLKAFKEFIHHKMDSMLGVAGFYGGQWGYTRADQPQLESIRDVLPKVRPKGIAASPTERVMKKGLSLSDTELDNLIKKKEKEKGK